MRRRPDLPEVFRGRDAIEAGALTSAELRGPMVRRLTHGVYTHRAVPDSHLLRCRAAALVGEGQLVLTGRSAATVRGVELATAADPVEVLTLTGARVHRRAELDVRRARVHAADHESWHEIRIARRERTAFDVASRGTLPSAVAALDQLLRAGQADELALARWVDGRHDHGVVQFRTALQMADGRAESPPESVLRVVLALAGIIGEPQLVVHDHAGFVARVDLGFARERLAVEYDGAWHSDRFALTRDRERLNRLQRAGWEVLTVTAGMLARPDLVVELVGTALAARRRRRAS